MNTTHRDKGPAHLALLTQADRERIEPQPLPLIGIVEPPPPYRAAPQRSLPSWAKHLRDLRHLTLME